MFYRLLKYLIARPLARCLWRARLAGGERIPRRGAVILAANHHSIAETVMLAALIARPLTFAAKAEVFEGRTPWRRFGAWFLRAVGQAPLDRAGGAASSSGLGSVEQVLAGGGLVGIFPEGKRSPDGRLHRGHTGVARLALDSGAPVLPVGMVGTDFRADGWFRSVRRQRPRILIGQPLDFEAARRAYQDAPDRPAAYAVLREATDQVMAAIQALTGQDYVDVYAGRRESLGPPS